MIDGVLVARLYGRTAAARWGLAAGDFGAALEASAAHAFRDRAASPREVADYLASLHLDDLALAAACAAGLDAAWDHFILTFRPALYRAADAIDRTGGGRDLADSLYADLFGLRERAGVRQSLFRLFHGRSALGTWIRAVLAQRHVDRLRAMRRTAPLPEPDTPGEPAADTRDPSPIGADRVALIHAALREAAAALDPRDRLRLGCYYVQNMTLSAIGRLIGEHEASVSRHLSRARRAIAAGVDRYLAARGLDRAGIDECLRAVTADPGAWRIQDMIGRAADGKIGAGDRST